MTQEQIEGSEMIVVFLGWIHEGHLRNHYSVPKEQNFTELNQTCYRLSEMKWHSDWNWMMFAWNKVRTRFFEENDNSYPEPFGTISDTWQMYTFLVNIDACFAMLVESIKTYNEQKTNQL